MRIALFIGLGVVMAASCVPGADIQLGGAPPVGMGGAATGGSGLSPASGGEGGVQSGGSSGSVGGTAGEAGAPWVRATNIRPIAELNSDEKDDNLTLTSDELIGCFTSKRPTTSGGTDIWCAERSSSSAPFGAPVEQTALNTDGFESSPALSADGLSIWFGSDAGDGIDVFYAMRPDRAPSWQWQTSSPVSELNSAEDDLPRPLALGGTVMPLSSRRGDSAYWTYLATRSGPQAPFSEPVVLSELAVSGRAVVDAFLTEDARMMLFTMAVDESDADPGDLYFAVRPDASSPFGQPEPVSGVNTSGDDRDPFLSADGRHLYFSSGLDEDLDFFVADVELNYP